MNSAFSPSCPIPLEDYPHVLLAHGGGGKLMHSLIEKMFKPLLRNEYLDQGHDSAVLSVPEGCLAFTSDSFVVSPLFFPGGDIGSLAVNGTVNDLAVSGAKPLYLSLSFIIEEGLPMETLWRVIQSLAQAARQAEVKIVTGDTKVVERGKGDGLFINTSGVGALRTGLRIGAAQIKAGDAVLVNGDIGRHGMCIMARRQGLEFETTIESDCAPLNGIIGDLLEAGVEVHCLRDLTRGGLGTVAVELAAACGKNLCLAQNAIVVHEEVQGACEILGFDPLYVANEGRFAAIVRREHAAKALEIMRAHEFGIEAAIIGQVNSAPAGLATLVSSIGTHRILDMLAGEQLPRIC